MLRCMVTNRVVMQKEIELPIIDSGIYTEKDVSLHLLPTQLGHLKTNIVKCFRLLQVADHFDACVLKDVVVFGG